MKGSWSYVPVLKCFWHHVLVNETVPDPTWQCSKAYDTTGWWMKQFLILRASPQRLLTPHAGRWNSSWSSVPEIKNIHNSTVHYIRDRRNNTIWSYPCPNKLGWYGFIYRSLTSGHSPEWWAIITQGNVFMCMNYISCSTPIVVGNRSGFNFVFTGNNSPNL